MSERTFEQIRLELENQKQREREERAKAEKLSKELQKICLHLHVFVAGHNMFGKQVRKCSDCGLVEGLGRGEDDFKVLTRVTN